MDLRVRNLDSSSPISPMSRSSSIATSIVLLALVGLAWSSLACNAEPRENTRRAGQSCVQSSDCLPNLTCRRRTCVPTSQRYSDTGVGENDASSSDAEGDGVSSDAEGGDASSRDVDTQSDTIDKPTDEESGVGEGGEVG